MWVRLGRGVLGNREYLAETTVIVQDLDSERLNRLFAERRSAVHQHHVSRPGRNVQGVAHTEFFFRVSVHGSTADFPSVRLTDQLEARVDIALPNINVLVRGGGRSSVALECIQVDGGYPVV